jgi:hypothetical protein
MRHALLAGLVMCLGSLATAQTSQPASELDAQTEAILDRLERKGATVKDLIAKIEYIKEDEVLQSRQVFTGALRFKEEDPNPRFLIKFDKSVHDGVVSNRAEWHAFDGRWYIEARESTRSINKREILAPGSKEDIFRLGEGPFPLPFGQKKADIVKHFRVRLIPPREGDPPNTDHLECTPLRGTKLARQYDAVHFYVDRKLDLPVKMTTVQREDEQQITANFSDLRVNTGMAGADLNLPAMPDYNVTEHRLEDAKASEK